MKGVVRSLKPHSSGISTASGPGVITELEVAILVAKVLPCSGPVASGLTRAGSTPLNVGPPLRKLGCTLSMVKPIIMSSIRGIE